MCTGHYGSSNSPSERRSSKGDNAAQQSVCYHFVPGTPMEARGMTWGSEMMMFTKGIMDCHRHLVGI